MNITDLAPEFQRWLRDVAREHRKSVEQVYAWWREYSRDCDAFDQSPVKSEFLDWYAERLAA